MGKSFVTAAGAAIALAALSACAARDVKIPDADPTPPLSVLDVVGPLEVVGRDGRLVLFTGEQPRQVELGGGDSVVLIALGEDRDGGVKDISLSGNIVATCGDPGQGKGEAMKTGSFARRHVLPAQPGRRVPGSRSARYVLRASDFRKLCGDRELLGVSGAAGARTVNFHGQSSMSPTLAFRLAAPRLADPDPQAASARSQAVPARSHATAAQASQSPQASLPVFGPLPPWEWPDTPRI